MTRLTSIVLCVLCALAAATSAYGQRTTRPRIRPVAEAAAPTDTTMKADTCDFTLFGYEKTLRSRRESVFITNRTGHTVTSVTIRARYTAADDGRELHSRHITKTQTILPGQTLQIDFPAWDKQQVWYYRLSETPRRATQATPFDASLTVTSYTIPKQ